MLSKNERCELRHLSTEEYRILSGTGQLSVAHSLEKLGLAECLGLGPCYGEKWRITDKGKTVIQNEPPLIEVKCYHCDGKGSTMEEQ